METELQAIEAELVRRVAREPAVQLLLSVTGVGTVAAATLWAYLGDPTRFRTAKQVTRYAGLDASVYQSGEGQRHGRISRNGCRFLRTVLVEAAHSVARHDSGPLGAFYRRKQRQIGPHKAVVALARKLLVVARPPGAEAAAAGQVAGSCPRLAGCASRAVAQGGNPTEATHVRGVASGRA